MGIKLNNPGGISIKKYNDDKAFELIVGVPIHENTMAGIVSVMILKTALTIL
ncbi:MAG: hypothetical protein K2X86_04335 [Cytophagaceae bacterium]|nr:hypothetical protein [Cytophagaceae bacterium]